MELQKNCTNDTKWYTRTGQRENQNVSLPFTFKTAVKLALFALLLAVHL